MTPGADRAKVSVSIMQFFVTAIARYPDKDETYNIEHTFGYLNSLSEAVDAVTRGAHMRESLYNYLVIEQYEPGLYPTGKAVYWYEWDVNKNWLENEDGWTKLDNPPEFAHHIVNWAF